MNRIINQFEFVPPTPEQAAMIAEIRVRFRNFAEQLALYIPDGPDFTVALRSLMTAKDDMIRAYLFAPKQDAA